jgi:hypothetical protein
MVLESIGGLVGFVFSFEFHDPTGLSYWGLHNCIDGTMSFAASFHLVLETQKSDKITGIRPLFCYNLLKSFNEQIKGVFLCCKHIIYLC